MLINNSKSKIYVNSKKTYVDIGFFGIDTGFDIHASYSTI